MWLWIFACILMVLVQVEGQIADLDFNLDNIESEDNYLIEKALKKSFDEFKKIYKKKYLTKNEHESRFKIFRNNLIKIRAMNIFEQGTAYHDVNEFADLTTEEFLDKYTGFKVNNSSSFGYTEPKFNKIELPLQFDWREKGAVTDVKDQGMCGSCYAFSAIGNIEGVNKVVNGKLISLSEEEIIDCDSSNQGCNGGLMTNAFKFIIKSGGVESEKDYPYRPFKNKQCLFNKNLTKVFINSYTTLNKNEKEIAQYLVENGPVSIAINSFAMQFYFGGISHPFKIFCNPNNLNHGVLLVGFGQVQRHGKPYPYWIIKNSWGKKWGKNGYYYVYRGDNTCGLAEMASSVVINKK